MNENIFQVPSDPFFSPHLYTNTIASAEITHYPDDLGMNLDLAKEQLKKYGYETLATFSKRKLYHVPI